MKIKWVDVMILLPIISLLSWAIWDIVGFAIWGREFLPSTISVRVRELQEISDGALCCIMCLIIGMILAHLFIK